MITLEQAKRLKEAGWAQVGDIIGQYYEGKQYYPVFIPTERDLVCWLELQCVYFVDIKYNKGLYAQHISKDALITHVYSCYFDNIHKPISQHSDFSECLVMAVEVVLKQGKESGR